MNKPLVNESVLDRISHSTTDQRHRDVNPDLDFFYPNPTEPVLLVRYKA
jgi:hypothetical protein